MPYINHSSDLVADWDDFCAYAQDCTRLAIGLGLISDEGGTLSILTQDGSRSCQLVPEGAYIRSSVSALSAGLMLEKTPSRRSYFDPYRLGLGAAAIRKEDYIVTIADLPSAEAMGFLLSCLLQYGVIGGRYVSQVIAENPGNAEEILEVFNLLEAPLHALAPRLSEHARA